MRKRKETLPYEGNYERALKEYNEKMKDPKFLKKQKRILKRKLLMKRRKTKLTLQLVKEVSKNGRKR